LAANTATLDALLKEDYGPAIRTQLNDETPELDLFERDATPWQGRERLEAIHVNRNRGSYFTAEGGNIPTAGRQQIENMRIPMRYHHGAITITKQLMVASRSSEGAFARGMRLEMDRLLDDLRVQRRFAIWGDGRGVRCLTSADPGTGTTISVDSPGGFAGASAANGCRFINVGDNVAFIEPVGLALRAGGTRLVTAISPAGTSFTISAAANAALDDNDLVVKAYGADASLAIGNTDFMHAPMGISGIVDDGTFVNLYFGLSRTTFPILQSVVISSVGALSADVIQRAIDVCMQVGNTQISYHLMHPSVVRAYLALMESDRRYMGADLKSPDLGTVAAKNTWNTGLNFGGIPLKRGIDAPYGYWFGVDNRQFVRYVADEGSWVDEDGAVLRRDTTAVDTFVGQYRIYENFASLRPNQCFRLDGITTTVISAHVV
jgi:hypothetical protein